MTNSLESFISSPSRNHIVFSNGRLDNLQYLDVGLELSTGVEDILSDRRLSMKSQDILNRLFSDCTNSSPVYGSYLAIENVGILFEPLLKLDIMALLNKWSQNNLLVVNMGKGCVANETFYLVDGDSRCTINLHTFNYIVTD